MNEREHRVRSYLTAGRSYLAATVATILVVSTVAMGGALLSRTAQSTHASNTSSDWSMTRGDAARSGSTAGHGPGPYAATDWKKAPDGRPTGVVVASGTAYLGVATYDGTYRETGAVHAYDATTGEVRWSRSDLAAIEGSPAVSNGTVFVAASLVDDGTTSPESGEGGLFALDATTGETEWSYDGTTDWYDRGSPTVANGTVYVANYTTVFAFDAETGEERWSVGTAGEAGNAGFAVADGSVYVAHGRNLTALDATTGAEQWSQTMSSADDSLSAPAASDGAIYVTSGRNRVHKLPPSGTVEWTRQVSNGLDHSVPNGISAPAVDDGVVFVTTDDDPEGDQREGQSVGTVHRLDAETGTEQWRFQTAADVDSAPSVTDGTVYVAGQFRQNTTTNDYRYNPAVFALNRSTGEERWSYLLEQTVYDDRYDTVAPANDRVYLVGHQPGPLTFNGYLAVLNGSETAPPRYHQLAPDEPTVENKYPEPSITIPGEDEEPVEVDVNQTLTLNASESYDPDGEIVAYRWDVDPDDEFEKTGEVVQTKVPPLCGDLVVRLEVEDDDGATGTAEITLSTT